MIGWRPALTPSSLTSCKTVCQAEADKASTFSRSEANAMTAERKRQLSRAESSLHPARTRRRSAPSPPLSHLRFEVAFCESATGSGLEVLLEARGSAS